MIVLLIPIQEAVTLPEAKDETVALLGHADDPVVVPEVEGDTVAVSVDISITTYT